MKKGETKGISKNLLAIIIILAILLSVISTYLSLTNTNNAGIYNPSGDASVGLYVPDQGRVGVYVENPNEVNDIGKRS
ncbi:hypothetical protein K8R47_02985 [archaeon]|nr:hypothetical protein [archaeon]